MFKSSKKKSTADKLVRQMEDLEQLCFTALQIDANILGAFDRRFHLRLEAYESRMEEVERRVTAMETLLDLTSQPGSLVAAGTSDADTVSPHTPLSQLGAAGGAPKDEGHFTFESGIAPVRPPRRARPTPPPLLPIRPPSWSAESIEAFLSRSGRIVESEEDRKEWLRIVQNMSPPTSTSASGKHNSFRLGFFKIKTRGSECTVQRNSATC